MKGYVVYTITAEILINRLIFINKYTKKYIKNEMRKSTAQRHGVR